MNDSLTYIDQYFKGELDAEEIKRFEQRIIEDPEFAGELSFYITSIQAIREQGALDKKEHFRSLYNKPAKIRSGLWKYMAAAAVVAGLVIGTFLIYSNPSPDKLANNYISANLATLGVMMNNSDDSLQRGIQLYNNNHLNEAAQYFESIVRSHPSDARAKEYAGIVSLRLENFDKALEYFGGLSQMTQLYANPGNFYVSLTLLKRNRPGDVQRAKSLLQQIVTQGAAKEEDARELLKRL